MTFGHATASLLVGKLSASGRQNTLAAALEEYGALRRAIYAAEYLSDPDFWRKTSRQLNKRESLHALRRDLLYAREGMIRSLRGRSWAVGCGSCRRSASPMAESKMVIEDGDRRIACTVR